MTSGVVCHLGIFGVVLTKVWVFSMSPNLTPAAPLSLQVRQHCYLMKQVLNFTLEEVLLPYSDRFQPYMQEVVSFLAGLSNKLSQCVSAPPSPEPTHSGWPAFPPAPMESPFPKPSLPHPRPGATSLPESSEIRVFIFA